MTPCLSISTHMHSCSGESFPCYSLWSARDDDEKDDGGECYRIVRDENGYALYVPSDVIWSAAKERERENEKMKVKGRKEQAKALFRQVNNEAITQMDSLFLIRRDIQSVKMYVRKRVEGIASLHQSQEEERGNANVMRALFCAAADCTEPRIRPGTRTPSTNCLWIMIWHHIYITRTPI